jgi:hypothetical protein
MMCRLTLRAEATFSVLSISASHPDAVRNLLRDGVRKRSGRPRSLRVEICSDGVRLLEDFLRSPVGHSILNVAHFSAGSHANHKTFGSISAANP